jgi:hypothetical protein
MKTQEFLDTSVQTPNLARSKPPRKWVQNLGFIAGGVLGGYFGYELADVAPFFYRFGTLDYVISQHPYLTQIACTAIGAVVGRRVGLGVGALTTRTQYNLATMRDKMFRRNGR